MISLVLVGIGGFFGALFRFSIDQWINKKNVSFPYNTLIVNVVGSFALGSLLNITIHQTVYLLINIGLLGSFTTFSTLTLDMFNLYKNRQWVSLFIYMTLTYVGGLIAAFTGMILLK